MASKALSLNIKDRWLTDDEYVQLKRVLLDPAMSFASLADWYKKAPKTTHPTEGESVDCRGVNIDGVHLDGGWLNYVLDGCSAIDCKFLRTCFQFASAKGSDFSKSQFREAQLSPFYAPDANFSECVFETCFFMGISVDDVFDGALSDLSGANFSGVKAIKTGFDRCNFRRSSLRNSIFIECNFSHADLRQVDLSDVYFERCDFSFARFQESARVLELLHTAENSGVNKINWGD